MIVVFILEDDDYICGSDYYRRVTCNYSSPPIFPLKWRMVKETMSLWVGHSVLEVNQETYPARYEFLRGVLPPDFVH
jgi:hypothetical protein